MNHFSGNGVNQNLTRIIPLEDSVLLLFIELVTLRKIKFLAKS